MVSASGKIIEIANIVVHFIPYITRSLYIWLTLLIFLPPASGKIIEIANIVVHFIPYITRSLYIGLTLPNIFTTSKTSGKNPQGYSNHLTLSLSQDISQDL